MSVCIGLCVYSSLQGKVNTFVLRTGNWTSPACIESQKQVGYKKTQQTANCFDSNTE